MYYIIYFMPIFGNYEIMFCFSFPYILMFFIFQLFFGYSYRNINYYKGIIFFIIFIENIFILIELKK